MKVLGSYRMKNGFINDGPRIQHRYIFDKSVFRASLEWASHCNGFTDGVMIKFGVFLEPAGNS